jgi:type II secretory pathway pseudopilin PulG
MEALVTMTIIVLALAIVLPLLFLARRNAARKEGERRVLQVVKGLIQYSQSGIDYYPGIRANGTVWQPSAAGRLQILLEDELFSPENVISPLERKTLWASGTLDSSQFSFALLDIDHPSYLGRRAEWRPTINRDAVVISDRNTGSDAVPNVRSIHSGTLGQWYGSVGWNDGHTTWEDDQLLTTRYGNGPRHVESDHLFRDDANGSDALMVYP